MLIFLFLIITSCSDEQTSNPRTDLTISNPIIENDSFFAGSHWNDPHVITVDDQFIMYASADIAWDGFVKIYRLISSDGINWSLNPATPVFEKAATGWDSHCTETPAVVIYNGEYHLFYTGYDVAYDYSDNGADTIAGTYDDDVAAKHFKIGHAVSPDGITFTRQGIVVEPTSPYTAPNLDFNQSIVGEPGPVVYNNRIYLYFTAVGAATEVGSTWETIGLVTYDGAAWDTPRRVVTPDLTLYPRNSGNQYLGYSTPNGVVINSRVHLYFDVVINNPWTQEKLHHAYSGDGETGWVQDDAPLMERTDYEWTAAEIRSPSALVHNNMLYLYFAGHVVSPEINLAIGLVLLPLP